MSLCNSSSVAVMVPGNFAEESYIVFRKIHGIYAEIRPWRFIINNEPNAVDAVRAFAREHTYVYIPRNKTNYWLVGRMEQLGLDIGMYEWQPGRLGDLFKIKSIYHNNLKNKEFQEVYNFLNPEEITFLGEPFERGA